MTRQITLIRRAEKPKTGYHRKRYILPKQVKIQIQVVESRKQIRRMERRRNRIFYVVVFPFVRIGQGADIADEDSFVEDIVQAGAL